MKTSLGRVPGGGPTPPGWLDLSTNGPMARRLADVVTALDVVVGPDPTDLRALPRPEASWLAALEDPHVPVRVAWSPTLGYATVDDEVLALCQRAVGVDDWLTLMGVCQLRTMRPFMSLPTWEDSDPVLRAIVDGAQHTTGERVVEVFDSCHRMNLTLVDLFRSVRILATPTCSGPAPMVGPQGLAMVNGEPTFNWVQLTYPFNMTRSPAATVCVGVTSSGLPVGLQLVGPQHGDLVVLRTAAALEAALDLEVLADV
jgi:Asp-tRNA(Asn)/Glu-tRNA(Gln) amidotransferase A subunit family amidase